MKLRKLFLAFLFFLTLSLGFISGVFLEKATALTDKIYEELQTFTRIMEVVDKQYVRPVDDKELVDGAIRGMLGALDPHTMYFSADEYKDFKSETTGKFGGVGIEVSLKDEVLTVVSPIDDSPAFQAGVHSGDRILKIDGKSTKKMSLFDAVRAMRGPKGKNVILTVWREGFSIPKDIVITRQIIEVSSIKSELLENGYAFIRISSFQEKTGGDLAETLEKINDENGGNLKGIILDLRDNPGGLLTQAIEVSDLFLSAGPIVSTKGRDQKEDISVAQAGSSYEKTPLVVLVNHGSASAAEIVSGALQDTARAKILGTTSYGKGSVQTILDMPDNAALKITIAKYYTPKGRSIDGIGIQPDVVIDEEKLKKDFAKVDEKERPSLADYQKQKAIELITKP